MCDFKWPLGPNILLGPIPRPLWPKVTFLLPLTPFPMSVTVNEISDHSNQGHHAYEWNPLKSVKDYYIGGIYQNKICWLYLLSLDKQTRVYCGKAVLNLIAIITNLLNHQWSFNMMPCALETPTSEMRWNWSNLKTRLCMYMLSKWGANQNKALCICSLLGRIWLNEIWTLRITKSLRAKPGGREKIRALSGALHETSNS